MRRWAPTVAGLVVCAVSLAACGGGAHVIGAGVRPSPPSRATTTGPTSPGTTATSPGSATTAPAVATPVTATVTHEITTELDQLNQSLDQASSDLSTSTTTGGT